MEEPGRDRDGRRGEHQPGLGLRLGQVLESWDLGTGERLRQSSSPGREQHAKPGACLGKKGSLTFAEKQQLETMLMMVAEPD